MQTGGQLDESDPPTHLVSAFSGSEGGGPF